MGWGLAGHSNQNHEEANNTGPEGNLGNHRQRFRVGVEDEGEGVDDLVGNYHVPCFDSTAIRQNID